MMHWYGTFRAAFFGAWADAGLPDPELHIDAYRSQITACGGHHDAPPAGTGPLHPDIVARVHGFGEVIGGALGQLLGVAPPHSLRRAAWCGRFNLGISLFDHVCDEGLRGDVLATVPPFDRFEGSGPRLDQPALRPEESFLVALASEAIEEFSEEVGDQLDAAEMFATMYHAERHASDWPLGPAVDLGAIKRMIRTKSAEPFALMATWMVAQEVEADFDLALRIGRAIGDCFWIVDDAKDLWTDLDSGTWNLFLLHAAAAEPTLFEQPRSTLRDVHLSRILAESDAAHRVSATVVAELSDTLSAMATPTQQREEALGVVAASVALW
jgi:hypothetical protein